MIADKSDPRSIYWIMRTRQSGVPRTRTGRKNRSICAIGDDLENPHDK